MNGDPDKSDVRVSNEAAPPASLPPLSADEKRILDIYDRLKDLQVEIALLTTRQESIPGSYTDSYSRPPSNTQRQTPQAT